MVPGPLGSTVDCGVTSSSPAHWGTCMSVWALSRVVGLRGVHNTRSRCVLCCSQCGKVPCMTGAFAVLLQAVATLPIRKLHVYGSNQNEPGTAGTACIAYIHVY
jgi:hypothetical protein